MRTLATVRVLLVPFLLGLVLAATGYPVRAQQTFTITDLGTLGGRNSTAYGVNDNGDVVGEAWLPGDIVRAFLWRGGTMTNLGTFPGHDRSYALAINNLGTVIGSSQSDTANSEVPFVWRDGVMTPLPLLPGDTSGIALAINNLGQIVGRSGNTAVTWIEGAVIPLDDAGAVFSGANGINDRGQIVGNAVLGTGRGVAVIWENGVMRPLSSPSLPGCTSPSCIFSSLAFAINEKGDVAGVAANLDERNYAVRWANGVGTSLPVPPEATNSWTYYGAINDAGEIAGNITVIENNVASDRAVLWSANGMQRLPTPSDAFPFSLALGISNAGHVVGASAVSALDSHALLWTRTGGGEPPPPLLIAVAVKGAAHIWPPNGALVPVTFTGTVQGAVSSVAFAVVDEYGHVQPSGTAQVTDGRFTITVHLQASRRGADKDGRRYTLRVTAAAGGQRASAAAFTVVPHDRR